MIEYRVMCDRCGLISTRSGYDSAQSDVRQHEEARESRNHSCRIFPRHSA